MSALKFLPLLPILTLSLQACAPERPEPIAAIRTVLAQDTPAARKAEIRRQLAKICPVPLSDVALERAAAYVETHRDAGAVVIVRDLSRLDAEARVCRGASTR
jgi:hypothetical protein